MSKKIFNLNNDNYDRFLKRLKYLKYYDEVFVFNYSRDFKHKEEAEQLLKALNMKDRYARYSYIYDEVCKYLDDLFIKKNMCEFQNDKCYSNRCKKFEKSCGCCSNNRGVECKYFDKDHCTIKCSGCKFYICPTLRKKKGAIRMKDIPLAYYLLNVRQQIVLRYSVFTPKDKILQKMLKFRI